MAATDVLSGSGAPAAPTSPMNNLDSTTKAYDVLHSVPVLGGLAKFLGFNDPNADMKKQWAYDSSKMQYEANLKDWLTKNSGQYNFNMAKAWEQNKYQYGKDGMIKAGINPLIATLGSGGFAGAPSTGGSGGSSSNGYHKDQKQSLGAKDVLAAGSSIAVGLAKILTMLM